MIAIRKNAARGATRIDWLNSRHTFSFGDYRDPKFDGFRDLRVINEDFVIAGSGFGTHGHRDMEILSYVLEGQLGHKDSMGNGSVIVPGDVQRMSAGTGVLHSEMNPSPTEPVHFLQIWIKPNVAGIAPGYEQTRFPPADKRGRLRLIASADGADGSVRIHQDVRIYAGLFDGTERSTLELPAHRKAYVHVARGKVTVGGVALAAGDGLAVTDTPSLTLSDGQDAEVLVFDLPA